MFVEAVALLIIVLSSSVVSINNISRCVVESFALSSYARLHRMVCNVSEELLHVESGIDTNALCLNVRNE